METLGSTETISRAHIHSVLCETQHLIGRRSHFRALSSHDRFALAGLHFPIHGKMISALFCITLIVYL
jgi:hypothetical protein